MTTILILFSIFIIFIVWVKISKKKKELLQQQEKLQREKSAIARQQYVDLQEEERMMEKHQISRQHAQQAIALERLKEREMKLQQSVLTDQDTALLKESTPKLINCPDCDKEVSRNADSCPNCGCLLKKPHKNEKKPFLDNASLNFLICAGFLGAAYFLLVFDTGVSTAIGRINNIGLMQDRQNYMLFCGAIGIVALIIKLNRSKK